MQLTVWSTASSPAGSIASPSDEAVESLDWIEGSVPGTAASILRESGRAIDGINFDELDWWFRTVIDGPPTPSAWLEFDGLATIASVWLNGERVLDSSNMFVQHTVAVSLRGQDDLVIVCRSVDEHLRVRRRRPRWKTRLVDHQQLRWVRTSLLGRIPGWAPGPAPVGPFRPVKVLRRDTPHLRVERLTATLNGTDGLVEIEAAIEGVSDVGRAAVRVGEVSSELAVATSGNAVRLMGSARVSAARPWFPHTHGEPELYPVAITLDLAAASLELAVGHVGFRDISFPINGEAVGLTVNGVGIFARGACWMPHDLARLWSTDDDLHHAVFQARDAGVNLIRIIGPTVYESPRFHELCDQAGIMVWQDFMFANMQYPVDDADFVESVSQEARLVARRLAAHPSTVVLCGGSEIEQQAAMMGLDESDANGHELGRSILAEIVADEAPHVPYVPCSPFGGHVPFAPSVGISHYYGVGAYLRPLDDARSSRVRFASECLAFANVPSRESVDLFMDASDLPPQSPRWKAGVPRDSGTGWDFDDVRDHYVERLFGTDPLLIRYADPSRYLDLGRAAVRHVVAETVGQWRRPSHPCRGAIVLALNDLRPGAGWGLIDSRGLPKSAMYGFRHASAPVTVLLADDGLDGLTATVHNDRPVELAGSLRIRVFAIDDSLIAEAATNIVLAPASSQEYSADAIVGGFLDLTFAYRFGPRRVGMVAADLLDENGDVRSRDRYLAGGFSSRQSAHPAFDATGAEVDDGIDLTITAQGIVEFVSIDLPGHHGDDDWFHLAPGETRVVRCHRHESKRWHGFGEVRALSSIGSVSVHVPGAGDGS